jgi:type I restriction enzyme S subunit
MTSDWTEQELGDLLDVVIDHRGRTPKKLGGDFAAHGIPVISAKNVKNSRLSLDNNLRFIEPAMWDKWMPVKLRAGDVLLTSEAPLGETAYLAGTQPFCLGQRLFALRADPGKLHSRYLFYALQGPLVRRRILARASGTTAQGIRQAELVHVPIPVPPVTEQKRIATVLAALDDKIDNNRRLAQVLEDVVATLFKAHFVDFVQHDDLVESGMGLVPRDWKVGRVDEVCEFEYGKALPAKAREPGEVLVVGSSGVVGSHRNGLYKGPGIVVGRKGTAGSVLWIHSDFFPIDTTFVALRKGTTPLLYLLHALRQVNFPQIVADSAVPGLNREAAYARRILLPPQSEMEAFESFAAPCYALRDQLLSAASTLEALRNVLLPRLMSGRLRIPLGAD